MQVSAPAFPGNSRLPRMPDVAAFDGSEKGLRDRDWLDTLQFFWDFNMSQAPQLQTTYAVSRLKDDAKRWYEAVLGTQYGRLALDALPKCLGKRSHSVPR